MSRMSRHLLVLSCLALVALTACRNRGGDGTTELPADIQKAVDDVVAQLEATTQAIGGAVEGFASIDLDDSSSNDCPEVVFVRQDNVTTLGLSFEPGCESEYYVDLAVSGSISVVFDGNVDSFNAEFDEFTVDGQSTDGGLQVSRTEGGDFRTWSGTIDIATSGVGSVVGDITLVINVVTQTISIESASLELTEEVGESISVEVEGIVIRPVANGNFVPQNGTVTFVVPNEDPEGPENITVSIEFDANSPVDGTVLVTFGEGTVSNYELPGF